MDNSYIICAIASVITIINIAGIIMFAVYRHINRAPKQENKKSDSVQNLKETLKDDISVSCEESYDGSGMKLYVIGQQQSNNISNQTEKAHKIEMDTKTLGYIINEKDFNPETWDGEGYLIK